MVVYNDDESIAKATVSEEEEDDSDFTIAAGKAQVTVDNMQEVTSDRTDFKVLFKLLGAGSLKDRPGVDLVAVLDVSGSMGPDDNPGKEDRIAKLKMAMQFVIKKLSPIDRLSVVKFNHTAKRLCPLRVVTPQSQKEIEYIINDLQAGGGTEIMGGLQLGLQVLKDRRENTGRAVAIMLMSDGEQPDARVVPLDVAVHTFGVGDDHDPKVLNAIAKNSKGGTFSDVRNDNLSIAFSQCLAGLLTVVVHELTFTVKSANDSEIIQVTAGSYPQTKNGVKSVTISFGDLYDRELRTIKVDLILPAVKPGTGGDAIIYTFTYQLPNGQLFTSAEMTTNISRVRTEVGPEREEIHNEEVRLKVIDMMNQAKDLAEGGNFTGATKKLAEASSYMEDEVENPTPLINSMKSEIRMMTKGMQNKQVYDKKGRSYMLSALTSHDLQRSAAKGDEVKKGAAYATPRKDAYVDQAVAFHDDPTKPLPTAEDDVKQEILADPLASVAGALSYHLKQAIASLQAVDDIINKGRRRS